MKKILIVEDELLIAMDLKDILEYSGYEVLDIVTNGKDAIDQITENKPDIVMLDVFLNGKQNGVDVAKIINLEFKLPFFFLTANTESNIYKTLLSVRPCGIISKPFDEKSLLEKISSFYSGVCSEA